MVDDCATKVRHEQNHVPRLLVKQPGQGPLKSNQSGNEWTRQRISAKQQLHLRMLFENVFTTLGMDLLRLFVNEERIHSQCTRCSPSSKSCRMRAAVRYCQV